MLYFSGGLTRQGIENQASIRSATNECGEGGHGAVRGGYTRSAGAEAGGRCFTGSKRGTAAYSGASMQGQLNSNFSSQETLGTLAGYGRQAVRRFERFRAGVPAGAARYRGVLHHRLPLHQPGADGSFRHLTVKLNHPKRSSNTGPDTMRRRTSSTPRARTASWR